MESPRICMGFDSLSHSVVPVRSPLLLLEIQNPLSPMETGGDIEVFRFMVFIRPLLDHLFFYFGFCS